MAKDKKNQVGGLPPPIRPTVETMQTFWSKIFRRYAEEIKPFQGAQTGGMAKVRRHASR